MSEETLLAQELNGSRGFWCQGDCVFIENETPEYAIDEYRRKLARAFIAISIGDACSAINRQKLARKLTKLEAFVQWVADGEPQGVDYSGHIFVGSAREVAKSL